MAQSFEQYNLTAFWRYAMMAEFISDLVFTLRTWYFNPFLDKGVLITFQVIQVNSQRAE